MDEVRAGKAAVLSMGRLRCNRSDGEHISVIEALIRRI